jgi:NitT/TauT family transport system substrate-binding protein
MGGAGYLKGRVSSDAICARVLIAGGPLDIHRTMIAGWLTAGKQGRGDGDAPLPAPYPRPKTRDETTSRSPLAAAALAMAAGVAAKRAAQGHITVGTTCSTPRKPTPPASTPRWGEGVDVIQPTNSTGPWAVLTGRHPVRQHGPGRGHRGTHQGRADWAVCPNMRQLPVPGGARVSPIKSIADFKGKTIGVISYCAAGRGHQELDRRVGWTRARRDFVETGRRQTVAALKSGQVTSGTLGFAIATAGNIESSCAASPHQAEKLTFGGSYFVRDDYIAKQPQVIEKVLRCIAQGSAMMIANPEGTVKAHWQVYPNTKPTGLDDAQAFAQALNLVKVRNDFLKIDSGARWGELPPAAAEVMVDFMRSNKRRGKLDPKDLYATSSSTR